MRWTFDHFEVTDERERLDFDFICDMLRTSYWAANRSRDAIERAWSASVPFSLWDGGRMIGFARAVTDDTTFSWIADVMIHPDYRGRGLGQFLMRCVTEHPQVRDTKILLATRDAQDFYERLGFIRREALWKLPKGMESPCGEAET